MILKRTKIVAALIIISISLSSCMNHESELSAKIKILEKENMEMKKILEKQDYKKIVDSQLLLIPQSDILKANESNTITVLLSEKQKFPKFKVYFADENYKYKEADEIKIERQDNNRFEFHYVPKTTKENKIRIVSVFDLDTAKVALCGNIDVTVK